MAGRVWLEVEERSIVAEGAPLDDGQVRVGGTAGAIVAALRADRVWVVTRRLGKAVAEPPHSKGSRCGDRRGVGLAARLD